ncbi:MAG TPA: hypothetical protein VE631_05380 [Alphaproteobacteria bacterium]|jgi:hypothetical protein|nr:hypothetical protein [Alphaproteobacteria bacterium]
MSMIALTNGYQARPAATEAEPRGADEASREVTRPFRGLVLAVPLSVAMWAGIIKVALILVG